MNSLQLNNYIQYLTRNGSVKTKSVVFVKNDTNTTFEIKGITEEYFILSVYENNIKKTGVGFDNIDNIDMLAFINSNFYDINTIPQSSFLSPEEKVILSYDNLYLKESNITFDLQKLLKNIISIPTKGVILPNVHNSDVIGLSFLVDQDFCTVFSISINNLGERLYSVKDYIGINLPSCGGYAHYMYKGFTFSFTQTDGFAFDFLFDISTNTFDIVTTLKVNQYVHNYDLGLIQYLNGYCRVPLSFFNYAYNQYSGGDVFIGFNVPVGTNFVPW